MLAALGLYVLGSRIVRNLLPRIRGATRRSTPASALLFYEAHFRSQSGDKNEAIRLLTDFFAKSPQQHAMAKDDHSWWWDPIRDDPRYKTLVGDTG